MKRALLIGAATLLLSGITPAYANEGTTVSTTPSSVVTYSDIQGHWAQKEIEYVLSIGAMSGYEDGTFRPNESVSKSKFAIIFSDLLKIKADKKPFEDTKGHVAEKAISGLVESKIIDSCYSVNLLVDNKIYKVDKSNKLVLAGTRKKGSEFPVYGYSTMHGGLYAVGSGLYFKDDKKINKRVAPKKDACDYSVNYSPNLAISRLDISKMFAKGLAKESKAWNGILTGFQKLDPIKLPFKDQTTISAKDLPYLALANASGIVSARSDSNFSAKGYVTRAEVAVMLKRYLDAKGTVPSSTQLLEKYKGEKPIHKFTKAEMEKWINKDADLKRLNKYPVKDDFFKTLPENNQFELHPNPLSNRTELISEGRVKPVQGYMNAFFNRNYTTIGDAWINNLRFYYREYHTYNGVFYSLDQLPKMFKKIVQETKSSKVVSESIFVTDVTMYHNSQTGNNVDMRVRGTHYIRYTSGSNLPKGVALNKWYKRDVDVEIQKPSNTHKVNWKTSDWVFEGLYPITSYQEVKK